MIDYIPYFLVILKAILIITAVIFFFSGLDDFFIDIYFGLRNLYRRLFVLPKHKPLNEAQLLIPPEQPIAVMVPAWKEADVIRAMLENSLRSFNYANYHIFVGTYPNDPDTQNEVEIVREKYDNVHRIVCPKDGPTNKADCLNWVYQGIKNFELDNKMEFAIFVMEDAEDIVHPLSLKLFNYLIPRKDMVQIPVFALECGWLDFTCGHYLDEFSENHYKNMVVREFLGHNIPSAGVGCAFSRRALEVGARENNNQLFSIHSLTEDYEIGIRLASYDLKTIFVKQAFEREIYKKSFWRRRPYKAKIRDYIAVREYFPKKFWSAVRQKSRWVVGIALQGWVHLGWQGDLRGKYMLYRDRKTLLTSQANMLGYFVVLAVLIYWFIIWYYPDAYRYPPLVERGSWLYYLILADTFFMFVRIFERFLCVRQFYNLGQAFFSIPRFVWGNIINFVATIRALYLFAKFLWTGKLIAWDKTDHVLPTEEEMRKYRRKLGDLLLERKYLTVQNLNLALAEQKKTNLPLGAVLLRMGLVKDDDLIQVLGMQLQLKTQEIDPYAVPLEAIQALPRKFAVKYSLFPLEATNGKLVVAAHNLVPLEQLEIIGNQVGKQLELRLATQSDLSFAIRNGYDRLVSTEDIGLAAHELATILLEQQIIPADQLKRALKTQRGSYMRLGDILVEQKVLSPAMVEQAVTDHLGQPYLRFGDFLVERNLISARELQEALALQASRFLKLGEILADMGLASDSIRKALTMAESRLISVDIFKNIIIMAKNTHLISEENLSKILVLFEDGRISGDILPDILDRIENGELSQEKLLKVITDVENGITSDSSLAQVLTHLEADRSHVTK